MNLQYLYTEENIDTYVNNVIKYQLGGFRKDEHGKDFKFLLNNKFGEGRNSYYVLYSGAINSADKFPFEFFFDESKQPVPEKRNDRKDKKAIFDELMTVILLAESCKAKIIYPYKIKNIYWLTGEIVVDKTGTDVAIELYIHNPYGGGELSVKNFSIINTTLHKIIEKRLQGGLQVISITKLLSPFTNGRQTTTDTTSCGVIVANEIVKRITNSSLTISLPYPQGAEQLRLSQLTFLQEKLGVGNLNYHLFKKQVTLSEGNLKENFSINPVDYVARPKKEASLTTEEVKEKVEQVIRSKESNIIKINQIKQLEKEHYTPLIQQLANTSSQEEVKDLVIVLKDLGHLTIKLGELSGEIKYYTEAATFYQYIIAIINERLNEKLISMEDKTEFIKEHLVNSYNKLSDIQQLIFFTIGGNQEKMLVVQEEAKSYKDFLLVLREKTDLYMETIEVYRQQVNRNSQQVKKYQERYVNAVRALFEYTAKDMKEFLAKLYNDSEQQMTIAPPCKYAVVGLGSMALQQMTPYSDLEFAILTENEDYKKSDDPKIREYFKNLSHLVNFKVINIGETVIPSSKYKLDMSHLVTVAVNFDLGGKTPLGRIDGDKPYELIKTVDWMLYYVVNKEDKSSHIDKNLPYILENVCYVHGDKKLVKAYQAKITEFLNDKNKYDSQGRLNCEIRAIKVLEEGVVEFDYLQKTPNLKPKETLFKGDLEKFQPKLFDTECRLFDVKQEIYRLLDRIIYNLRLYYGIEGDSCWETLDKFEQQGIFTLEAIQNIKNAISFATTLRLKTYSHYKAQKENVSIFLKPAETEFALREQSKQIFHLSEEDLGEQGGLFQYFYTAVPLHERIKELCNQQKTLSNKKSKETFFQNTNLYNDDCASKGLIHYRLAQYTKAQSNFEEAVKYPNNKYNLLIRMSLGNIYMNFGNNDQAIEQFQYCKNICEHIYQTEPLYSVAASFASLGSAYAKKGQYDKAISYFKKNLKMIKLIYQYEAHPDVAASFNNMGEMFRLEGQYNLAINNYEESIKISKRFCKDEPHPGVACFLDNLGLAYKAKGQYDLAIKYHLESLKMNTLIYKNEPHKSTFDCFDNLGVSYKGKGLHDQAIKYHKDSLKMKKLIYKNLPHPDVAVSLNYLGSVNYTKGQYDKAIKYFEKSIKINEFIYKDELQPDVAASFNNLGEVYRAKGKYYNAIYYYEKSLKIQKHIYQDEPHSNVATPINNLGVVSLVKGQYDQALKYFEKSLKMRKLIYQDKPHPDVATSFNNLGLVYDATGKYDQAIKYHEVSLKMRKNVAKSLGNLGKAYAFQNQYDKAISYCKESLKIQKLIYLDKPHPSVADSLNDLGEYYRYKGHNDWAIRNFQKSIGMNKLIYNSEPHPNVAGSLNNLGSVYLAKGQYDQAIKYYKESLKMNNLIFHNEPHPSVATSLNNLGEVYYVKDKFDKAIRYFKKSLKMRKVIYKKEAHPCVASSFNSLGRVYRAKGQYDQAIKYFEKNLAMEERIYKNQSHPGVAASLNNLGVSYASIGKYDKAIKCNSQALQIILDFQDHPYTDTIKNQLIKTAVLFAEKYSLNLQKVSNKILSFAIQKLDFTNHELHFALALSQYDKESLQQVAEKIEEYNLTLIFLPKEELATKLAICNKLAELTGEDNRNIEL